MPERPPTFWELAVQATSDTRQGYNLLAPRFELTPYATPEWLIEACRARVDRLYPLPEEALGADLACGTGRAALVLARSCARVRGYDFSPRMLAQARAAAERRGLAARTTFLEADLARLQLGESCYHRLVSFGAWGHILPEWRRCLLHTVVRALAPGGVFYTVTADPSGPWSGLWWRSAIFDTAIRLRNRLLRDPFHMYYLLNDTLTVKGLLEQVGGGQIQIRLEPLPRRPHPPLTLLVARRAWPTGGRVSPQTQ
jgi:SAM-dependent methyltransferase